MVVIAIALQNRLLEAARRQLGPNGEVFLRDITERTAGTTLEQVSYAQLPKLFEAVEREAPAAAGRDSATALAEELDRLHAHADADLSDRLARALERVIGPAADACVGTICRRLGFAPEELDRAHLPEFAAAVEHEAAGLLGADTARALAAAAEETRRARPPGLGLLVAQVATEHAGEEGEQVVRALCHERLEVDLDEVDVEGIALLARAVEHDGAGRIGAARTAAFLIAARQAIVAPGAALRTRLLELGHQFVGPAATVFLKKLTAAQGLPFEAISYEHLMWLAGLLRVETTPLIGGQDADEFAAAVRGLLTEGGMA